MTIEEIIARAMSGSKAWPAVFASGSAAELSRASLDALDAAGYVVMPKEPTDAMIEAGKEGFLEAGFVAIDRDPLNVWRRMLHEARPK